MSFPEIKAALDQLGERHKAFQQSQDEKIAALKGELDGARSRIEELESRGRNAGRGPRDEEKSEHCKLFEKWMRRPHDLSLKHQLAEYEADVLSKKSINLGTSAEGGAAVPEEISREIGRLELLFSPVRSLVKVQPVGSGDFKALVNKRGTASGWVGETGTRSETATPTFRERVPTFGEIYAYPQVTEWALDDMFFNVGDWLAQEVAQEFAQEEGAAVISGNGTSKPTGMLNTPPVTTADFASPERSANAYQAVTSDLTPGGVGILADDLITLYYTLASAYRARSTWVMNSLTAAAVRKLKNSQNDYIWQQGLAAGQPDLLLGRPVAIWENMPNIGANNFPVAVGDWQRAYILADRTQIRITVDANITTPGRIKYYVRRREGGHVLDNHAAKFLQTL